MATISENQLTLVKKLYYQDRLSVPEVARTLKTSVDEAYYFMRQHELKRRGLQEQSRARFERKPLSFQLKSELTLEEEKLKVAGAMLYWGEGFQSSDADCVDFANSKPGMISLFLKFLRKVCGVQETRLRLYLYCYANQNPMDLMKFWSKLTRMPLSKFTKPYIRSDFDKAKINKMKFGLLHIRYYDKKLLQVIRGWIEEYSNKLGADGRVVNYTTL